MTKPMNILSEPLSGDLPAGHDCQFEIQSQNFALMGEYLVERAVQKGRDRAANAGDLGEGEARNAAAMREDGRRRLASLDGILRDVLRQSAVNTEQVAAVLRDQSSDLLALRGKDLRLVAHLGAACTVTDGLGGYTAALTLAAALLKAYPATLFPLPDADDPADVWQRANAVSDLLSSDGIRALLGPVIVVDARQAGRLTLAELVGGVRGDIPVAEVAQIDLDAALTEIGIERVQALLNTLRSIETSIAELVRAFDVGTLPTPRLADTFRRATARVAAFVATHAASAAPAPGANGFGLDNGHDICAARDTSLANLGSDLTAAAASGGNGAGGLRSRDDACRAIQDVIHLLEQLVPGHPAPLLLKRAHRLLGMSFVDIIKDMAPGAMSDIERIVGAELAV